MGPKPRATKMTDTTVLLSAIGILGGVCIPFLFKTIKDAYTERIADLIAQRDDAFAQRDFAHEEAKRANEDYRKTVQEKDEQFKTIVELARELKKDG